MEKNLVSLVQREREKDLALKRGKKGGNTMTEIVEKKKKERFETVPTHLPDINLRVEPETKPTILQKVIERFYRFAKQYARTYWQIKKADKNQGQLKEKIVGMVKANEGLRGLTSKKDNFILTVSPREDVTWNKDLLEDSLGIIYPAIVREELKISILTPGGLLNKESVIKAITDAVSSLGIPSEEIVKVMKVKTDFAVDEKKLEEMIKEGRVTLLPDTKTVGIEWPVKVDKLEKGK